MRILIVGAGALGGYFGGRLLQAGRDITFLLRPRRAAQLAQTGLVIKSPHADANLPAPPYLLSEQIHSPFDVVLVASKAYDLAGTMDSMAAAVGPGTAILPLLNGMRHIDELSARFGEDRVLGGQCMISAALDPNGIILHLNEIHAISFGERDKPNGLRIDSIAAEFRGANFVSRASTNILQEMWEKWIFIAAAAGITCLMRASIGDIVSAGGADFGVRLYQECAAIASAAGFPPGEAFGQRVRKMLATPGSPMQASMLRDIERGGPTEADHILGDLLGRGDPDPDANPLLRIAYAHLKAYEARRRSAS